MLQGMRQQALNRAEKSTERASTAMENPALCNGPSRVYYEWSSYTAQRAHPCKTFKGTGNLHELEAAASSPRRVVRARGDHGTCSHPVPAIAAAPTSIRVSTPHLPVHWRPPAGLTDEETMKTDGSQPVGSSWLRWSARAGSGPAAGPGPMCTE